MGSNSQPRGRCIFCGGHGLTKEHVNPQWLERLIPKDAVTHGIHDHQFEELPDGTRRRRPGAIRHLYQGDVLSRKVRKPCLTCNTGWMGKLQEQVKPILAPLIKGEPVSLSKADQLALATWVTMENIIAEYLVPDTVAITDDERRWFYQNQLPLPHWMILIGSYDGNLWNKRRSMDNRLMSSPDRDIIGPSKYNLQVTQFAYGQFLCFSAFTRGFSMSLHFPAHIRVKLHTIHPHVEEDIVFTESLNDVEADVLADTINFTRRYESTTQSPEADQHGIANVAPTGDNP